jgi:hypothetical protein
MPARDRAEWHGSREARGGAEGVGDGGLSAPSAEIVRPLRAYLLQ